jgi:hypothetical protein
LESSERRYSLDTFPLRRETRIIAPFFGDVDTRSHGELFFRESTNLTLRSAVDDTIHQAFPDEGVFAAQSVTVATWNEVGYFREMSDLVSRVMMCYVESTAFMAKLRIF